MKRKTIGYVSGLSLDLPACKNRLIPIIEKIILEGNQIVIYSPTKSKLNINNNSITYICLNISSDNSNNFYIRSIYELITSFKIMKIAYKQKHDLLIVGIPSIFNLFFSKRIKSRQYIDIRDLVWNYIQTSNPFHRLIRFFFTKLARNRLSVFDIIICTNKSEYNYLKKFLNIDKKRIYLLRNGISKTQFSDLSRIKTSTIKFDSMRPKISYIGNIGSAQHLQTYLYAARNISEMDFNIVGHGREFKKINYLTKSMNIKNVKLTNRLEWSDVLNIYKESDILFAQLTANFSGAVPSKLYEYLSSGRYIIYAGCGEAKTFLSEFNHNTVISPLDKNELINAIYSVIESKIYTEVSESNRKKIEAEYIREVMVKNFYERYLSF